MNQPITKLPTFAPPTGGSQELVNHRRHQKHAKRPPNPDVPEADLSGVTASPAPPLQCIAAEVCHRRSGTPPLSHAFDRGPGFPKPWLEIRRFRSEIRPINPILTLREHLTSPVIQFGPPRTGSTLVWNAARTVCPELPIPKRHTLSFLHRSPLCRARFIITVRHPLDIIASMLQVSGLDPTPHAIGDKIAELNRQGMADAVRLRTSPRALIIRYEEIYGDFDRLFTWIEDFLGRTAPPAARNRFEARFSINAVRKRAEALGGFERFAAEDQVHGRHISPQSGRPGYHAELFDPSTISLIQERFSHFIRAFGY